MERFNFTLLKCLLVLSFSFSISSLYAQPRLALVTTVYHFNSHADVIAGRFLKSSTLDDKGKKYVCQIVSGYIEQRVANDIGHGIFYEKKIPVYDTVAETLTLGGDELAVDGVLLICEHGTYPKNKYGATMYPKRRLFAEICRVFRKTRCSVPVFVDKHLGEDWANIKYVWDMARYNKVPLMAGSSIPITWRYPPVDIKTDTFLDEVVGITYHSLDAYGIHGLEALQSLVERRKGGETGVSSVRYDKGKKVWDNVPADLLNEALSALGHTRESIKPKNPELVSITYNDGLKVYMTNPNGVHAGWAAAWRYEGGLRKTHFWTHEARPMMHFASLAKHIDDFMVLGRASWPAKRTLLSSGVLYSAMVSRSEKCTINTPHLAIAYRSNFKWEQLNKP